MLVLVIVPWSLSMHPAHKTARAGSSSKRRGATGAFKSTKVDNDKLSQLFATAAED